MKKIIAFLVLSLMLVAVQADITPLNAATRVVAPVRAPSKTGGPDGSNKPIPPQKLVRPSARHLRFR